MDVTSCVTLINGDHFNLKLCILNSKKCFISSPYRYDKCSLVTFIWEHNHSWDLDTSKTKKTVNTKELFLNCLLFFDQSEVKSNHNFTTRP